MSTTIGSGDGSIRAEHGRLDAMGPTSADELARGLLEAGYLAGEATALVAFLATRLGVPIVPVGIGGSERALPRGAKFIKPVKIHVVVGPAIQPPPPKANGHPSRRHVRELTDTLQDELQRLFDRARIVAGDR